MVARWPEVRHHHGNGMYIPFRLLLALLMTLLRRLALAVVLFMHDF